MIPGCPPSPACAGGATDPEAIRDFCERIGVAKNDSIVDMALLEHCVRKTNRRGPARNGRASPSPSGDRRILKDRRRRLSVPIIRRILRWECGRPPFHGSSLIERDDFLILPKKYQRLRARPRGAPAVCIYRQVCECVKDPKTGEATEIHCTYRSDHSNRVPRGWREWEGIIHWVSATHSVPAEVRLYDRLFRVANPMGRRAVTDYLIRNPWRP